MIKSKGIFAVSFIAMMVVGGAYANIASQGYVDQQVDAKQNASTAVKVATAGTAVGDATHPVYVNASGVATRIDKVAAAASADTATSATKATQDGNGANIANTYAKKTELPTVNDATLTIQKNGATVDTFTANASANKTINITVPTTTSGLTNDSGFITADDLPDGYNLPVATANVLGGVKSGGDITVATSGAVTVNSATQADTATSATKATQDASGNVITTTYATKTELTNGLSGKQATLSGAQLNAVNSGITSTKVSTYDGYNAKITAAKTAADAAQTAANSKVTANAAITAGTATKITYDAKGLVTAGASLTANDIPTIPSTKVSGLGTLATKSAVTNAEITDGTITNADISASAAIAKTKLASDVQTSLGKADTAIQSDDLAQVATSGSYNDLTDKPTIPAAITVDSALSSTSTNPVQNKVVNAAIDAAQSTADDAADAASAAQNAINNLDVSTASGSGNVVTSVTQSNGKISVTKGNVQIPVGSATATSSYATIWVQ